MVTSYDVVVTSSGDACGGSDMIAEQEYSCSGWSAGEMYTFNVYSRNCMGRGTDAVSVAVMLSGELTCLLIIYIVVV